MGEVFLLEITCLWCRQSFYMCHSCWRGHRYCSALCKDLGYRRCKKKRQDLYRESKKGKKTRRRAERKRSLRQSSKKSGDAGSPPALSVITSPLIQSLHEPCCHFCGQKGVLFNQFIQQSYEGRLDNASDDQKAPP